MSQASGLSSSDVLRGAEAPQAHLYEPARDFDGCRRILGDERHRWYCGHLPSHPIHQLPSFGDVVEGGRL